MQTVKHALHLNARGLALKQIDFAVVGNGLPMLTLFLHRRLVPGRQPFLRRVAGNAKRPEQRVNVSGFLRGRLALVHHADGHIHPPVDQLVKERGRACLGVQEDGNTVGVVLSTRGSSSGLLKDASPSCGLFFGCGSRTNGIGIRSSLVSKALSFSRAAASVGPLCGLLFEALLVDFRSGVPRGISTLRNFKIGWNNLVRRLLDLCQELPEHRHAEIIRSAKRRRISEPRVAVLVAVVLRPIFVGTVFALLARYL